MCSFICYFLSTVGGLHAFFTLVNTYVLCFINWVSLPSCTVCSPTLPISVTVRLTLSPKGNFQSCLGYIPIYLVDGCFDSLFLFKKKKAVSENQETQHTEHNVGFSVKIGLCPLSLTFSVQFNFVLSIMCQLPSSFILRNKYVNWNIIS